MAVLIKLKLCLFYVLIIAFLPCYSFMRIEATPKPDSHERNTPFVDKFLQEVKKSKSLQNLFRTIKKPENRHSFFGGAYNFSVTYHVPDSFLESLVLMKAVEAVPWDVDVYSFAKKHIVTNEKFLTRFGLLNNANALHMSGNYSKILKNSVRSYGKHLNSDLYLNSIIDTLNKFYEPFNILNADTVPLMLHYFDQQMYSTLSK